MAANDYFSSFNAGNNNPAASRPQPPQHTPSTHSISPVSSPFDDTNRYDYSSTAHLAHTQTPSSSVYDTSYHGAQQPEAHPYNSRYDSPPSPGHPDPFADQNAIPLQQHGKSGEGHDPSGVYGMDPEGRRPREKRRKKKGWFSGRVTWMVYILTAVQTKPFNPMIGPSPYVLINMGARYQPCMHYVKSVLDSHITQWPCPNTRNEDNVKATCTLSELCGMGGVPEQDPDLTWDNRGTKENSEPNQWWRFITPIFLHAGLIHIGFNMLLQLTLGRDMEKEIGPLRFLLVYFSSGIFGFVLGGNYAAEGIASVGASGSLFGILALVLLDLLYNWSSRRSPVKDLLFLLLDIAISFVLGLLPGLDNFSHIGGFLMGFVLGICILHSPQALRERIGVDEPPYATVDSALDAAPGIQKFVKQPVGFFKGRKPFWWAWWLVRAALLVVIFVGFILLIRNFYEWRNGCSWCHHLTCLPIKTGNTTWCDIGNIQATTTPADPVPAATPPPAVRLF